MTKGIYGASSVSDRALSAFTYLEEWLWLSKGKTWLDIPQKETYNTLFLKPGNGCRILLEGMKHGRNIPSFGVKEIWVLI